MVNHFGSIVNTIMVHHNIAMTNPKEAQMKLRLPPEMRDKIAEISKASNRSMNAEIVERLQSSFGEATGYQLPELRLTLDAGDQPICWDEIHEYMRAIRKKMAVNDVTLHVTVLAGAHVSSNEREAETALLAKKLRKNS